MRQQKFSGVGRAEICQRVSAGNLRKTIFDTFLLEYPIVSIVRPDRSYCSAFMDGDNTIRRLMSIGHTGREQSRYTYPRCI